MSISDRIRAVLQTTGRLGSPVEALDDDADLYQAGLTSHASVNLMLALEDEFEVEFPEAQLRRCTFESIANISSALQSLGVLREHA
jgi:acyl carrier protein